MTESNPAFFRPRVCGAAPVLAPDAPLTHVATATVAAFYSISAAHPGLRGASLGNLLIRRTLAAVPAQVDLRG